MWDGFQKGVVDCVVMWVDAGEMMMMVMNVVSTGGHCGRGVLLGVGDGGRSGVQLGCIHVRRGVGDQILMQRWVVVHSD